MIQYFCRRCDSEVMSILLMTQQDPVVESWLHSCSNCGFLSAGDVISEKDRDEASKD